MANRHVPLLTLVGILVWSVAAVSSGQSDTPTAAIDNRGLAAASRPNIIVVMTDDLDERTLNKAIEIGFMPTFQRVFLEKGVKFSNSFVTNSLCCPSRATFLTGKYSHNHGALTNEGGYTVFDDNSTLATWLRDAGYQTAFIGKYLNGYNATKDLNGDGQIDDSERGYVPPGWTYWQGLIDPSTYRMYNYKVRNGLEGRVELYPETYQTDLLARKAVEFLDIVRGQNPQGPYFLYVSTLAPHEETKVSGVLSCESQGASRIFAVRAAPRHMGSAEGVPLPMSPSLNEWDISDKPDWLRQRFELLLTNEHIACFEKIYQGRLESLRAVDDLIRDVMQALNRNGQTNTVLIFSSDNGFLLGEHRLAEKAYAYEESIRVPLYIRDLVSTTPQVIEAAVLNNDLAPTIAELAGATVVTDVDGRSFLPLLPGSHPATWRKRFLVEHFPSGASDPIPTYAAVRDVSSTSASPWVYVEYKAAGVEGDAWGGCLPGHCEYYDLRSDPYQQKSLHNSPALLPLIPILESLIKAFRACSGEACRGLEDMDSPVSSGVLPTLTPEHLWTDTRGR